MPRAHSWLVLFVVGWWFALPGRAQDLAEARALHGAGRSQEALVAYRAVAQRTVGTDPSTAGIAHNNACVLLIDLGDYPAAHGECAAALPLRRQDGDPRGLARTLNNLGLALRHLGRYDEATVATKEALALNRARDDVEGEAVNRSNLAGIAIQAGHYGDALSHLGTVVALTAEHADRAWAQAQNALARINLGVALERLGAYQEALDTYGDLLDDPSTLSPRHRAALRVNAGTLYRNLGDGPRAAEQLNDAVTRWEEVGDVAALANAKLNLALVMHRNLARPAEAERVYREALALALQSGDRSEEMMILIHLGDLLVEADRLAEATAVFAQCLERAETTGSARGRWSALDGLARIDARNGQRDQAIGRLRDAITVIEGVRAGVNRPSLRASYFRSQREVYDRAVLLLIDPAREHRDDQAIADAFALVQQAKVRELVETLGVHGRLVGPARPDDIQHALGGATLISFFQADDRLLRWTWTKDDVRFDEVGAAASIADDIAQLHHQLETGATLAPALLDRLAVLLPPAIEPVDNLYVAPDGLLHYLPFELLLASRDRPPVTVYLPSASALLRANEPAAMPSYRLVGFADPTLPATQTAPLSPFEWLTAGGPLPGLDRAAAELRDAADRIGGPTWIASGADATEAAFRRWAPTGRILHVATHSVVDEAGGNRAAVLLAANDQHDGLLYPEEISALALPADLAVLAACRTALGSRDSGRGISSLTGAFLAAGASAVIATLWDVSDQATAVFMQQLYHELRRGHTPANAVHNVKQRLLADPRWTHPSLWAAYVVIGDGPPVVLAPRRWPWFLGVVAATAAVLCLVWRLRRRRNQGV